MTSSSTARRGPAPDGDQALIVQSEVPAFARMARAIDPPINPNPMKPRCIRPSIAAATRPARLG